MYSGYKQLAMHPDGRVWVSEITVRKLEIHDASEAIPENVRSDSRVRVRACVRACVCVLACVNIP